MFSKFVAFLLLLFVLASFTWKVSQQTYPDIPDNLLFQRVDGLEQTFGEIKGKPVVVTFWSPSCVICLSEVDELNALYRRNQGGTKFELLAPSMYYDRPDWVIDSSEKTGMTYPVYFDLSKKLSKAFGNVVATPTTFLINSKGEIIYRHSGRLDFLYLQQQLKLAIG
jgi:thiol-disulfide isomerase/thioredoxin